MPRSPEDLYYEKEIREILSYVISVTSKEDLCRLDYNFDEVEGDIAESGELALAFMELCGIVSEDLKISLPLRFKQKVFTLATLLELDEDGCWTKIKYSAD